MCFNRREFQTKESMARLSSLIWFALVTVHVFRLYIVSGSMLHSVSQYPSVSLACKLHNTTNMDCSHRNLFQIPELKESSITTLDFSNNILQNITTEPFLQSLQNLLTLNLKTNEISLLSSTAFKGTNCLKKIREIAHV